MAGQAAPSTRPLLVPLLFLLIVVPIYVGAADEGAALLRFKATLSGPGSDLLSWLPGAAPCNINYTTWDGVICFNGRVWGVQLEGKSLTGRLDLEPLVALRGLRTLSFMSNDLEGPLPDLSRLGALKAVYFSDNKFSGEISDAAFGGMRSLKKVLLSKNHFSGPIPTSLAMLGKLLEARLDHNRFVGRIPDFSQPELKVVDVSFNCLVGAIPQTLSKMDARMFEGNDGLCGAPSVAACNKHGLPKKGLSGGILASIILASIAALLILVFIIFFFIRRRQQAAAASPIPSKKTDASSEADGLEQGLAVHQHGSSTASSPARSTGGEGKAAADGGKKDGKENEHGRLLFVQDGRKRFELQDLLRASAEVLGSGNFGASYKATLSVGTTVVVKRFKEMNGVGREDFNEHMRRLGRLSHPNVLPLVAYYYKKEEKLLVSDFAANGSLALLLHGKRGSTLPPLDWPIRLKILKGVARGLAYLYDELPVLSLPHGHLKSSNVLLDENLKPLLSDYALAPVMNSTTASQVMVAYKSPEATQFGRPSKKSDVWSLGILILEILTGKFPANFLQKGKAAGSGGTADLAVWVSSVAQEDWSSELFDGDMGGVAAELQGEMDKLLKIGMDCCEEDVDKRLDMREALQRIEEL